jgi:hypothetical protein
MLNFLQQQFVFYSTILLVLFLPGYFLIRAFLKNYFNGLEKFLFSFGLSLVVVDLMMLIIGRLQIPITRLSILIGVFSIIVISFLISKFLHRDENNFALSVDFSKKQITLIIIIFFLSIFFKTVFLYDSMFPTSTDLGHHMYWSKVISVTGQLPNYAKQNIVTTTDPYQITAPQPISDFIIGEHLPFSAINLVSGIDYISYFPSLVLFLVDMMSILAVFVLTLKLFFNTPYGKSAAILALLLIGPLYAISSPQAKYVSGGVIGNIIGNLLLPIIFYFLYRAFREKNSKLLLLGMIFIFGLFYTHHLSGFVFLFAFAFSVLFFLIFNFRELKSHPPDFKKLIFSKYTIGFFICAAIFFFAVSMPTYFETGAVSTAVGTPTKATRTGYTASQLRSTAGEARMALGLVGFALLIFLKRRKKYSSIFLLGWSGALFVMSLEPAWLFVNIPSDRISNYITYPLAITSAFGFSWIFYRYKNQAESKTLQRFAASLFILIFGFMALSGFYDNYKSLSSDNSKSAAKTFDASRYLADEVGTKDAVLKDHIYMTADTWIKLFFMKDYNFPFSRSVLKRYEDSSRENCTLNMISNLNSPDGQKCFSDLGIDFIMVNPQFDSTQFQKSKDFWQVYSNGEVNVYYKNQ